MELLEQYLPTGSMPETHRVRLRWQQEGQGVYLLAWQDDRPAGHLFLHFQRPLEHASLWSLPESAYVEALATSIDRQRQGIATALMWNAEDFARQHGAQNIGLSVGVDNIPAQALYRKLGYQPSGIPAYCVTWEYVDEKTGQIGQEGELCEFWWKPLA